MPEAVGAVSAPIVLRNSFIHPSVISASRDERSRGIVTSEISPRYAELYWYYRSYFADYQSSQNLQVDDGAAHAYGVEHASATFLAEGGTPPGPTVVPTAPDAPASVAPSEIAAVHSVEPAPIVAPEAAQTQPPVSVPTTPHRARTGLLIGVIAAAAALALVAAGIVFVPRLLGGSASTSRLDDIRSEPSTSWSYETAGSPADFTDSTTFAELSGGRILAVTSFDYFAWSDENGTDGYSLVEWYAGVDADYQVGWDAGAAYEAAVDAAFDDFSMPFPNREDFYPAEFGGVTPVEATFTEEHAGAFAGWYDAFLGDEFGTSLPSEPVVPDDGSTIAVLKASDGEELWSVEVVDVLNDHDPSAGFSAMAAGSDDQHIVVYNYSFSTRGSLETSTIAVLDARTGDLSSSAELDGVIRSAVIVGDSLVATVVEASGDEAFDGMVVAIPLTDIDADPVWSFDFDVEDAPFLAGFGSDAFSLTVYDEDDTTVVEYYSAATGKETAWSDGRRVIAVGDSRIAIEDGDDDMVELSAINSEGKDLWTVEGALYRVVDGTLFVWEECDDSCEDMSPIDLGSGDARWKKGVDDVYPLVIEGDRVLVQVIDGGSAERQLEWLSLGSGEEVDVDAPKLPSGVDSGDIRVAQSMLLVSTDDELLAFSFTERKALWSFDLDDDERIRTIGKRLYLWNDGKTELSQLVGG